MTLYIYTDDGSDRIVSQVTNAQVAVPVSGISDTEYEWEDFTFATPVSLNATTRYWIVVTAAATDGENCIIWGLDTSSPSYAGGVFGYHTLLQTSGWTHEDGNDCIFDVWGY